MVHRLAERTKSGSGLLLVEDDSLDFAIGDGKRGDKFHVRHDTVVM